jgi:hypothetical protein
MERIENPEPAARWVRVVPRWLPGVVVGAGVGFALGWRTAYCLSAPLYGSEGDLVVQGVLLGVVAALLVMGLVGWAAARHSWSPAIAAATLVVAWFVGGSLAPTVPGSQQSASGTGSAGTREDLAAYWSGSVICRWQEGDATVGSVDGFDVQVSDPEMLAALGLDDAALGLVPPIRITGIPMPWGEEVATGLGVDDGGWIGSERTVLSFEGLSGDRRSGTAVAVDEVLVFTWSCSRGP